MVYRVGEKLKVATVLLTEKAEKSLRRLPKYIINIFDDWVNLIENYGHDEMSKIPGYRDHALKGNLSGKRSSSLNRSYRVIYELSNETTLIVKVIEVNKHDYKI